MTISYELPTVKNIDAFRRALNAILADIKSKQPTYGAATPVSVTGHGDGALYVKTGVTPHIYQVQSGSWVLVV